jgi:two-component system, OmpR family, sensor kinase
MQRPDRWIGDLAARTSLRVKLVATVLVVATVGLAVAASAATTLTHSYLLGRVDNSLMNARVPVASRYGGGDFSGGFGGGTGAQSGGPESPESTSSAGGGNGSSGGHAAGPFSQFVVSVYSSNGSKYSSVPEFEGPNSPPKLPTLTTAYINSKHGKPFSVPSADGKHSYRVVVLGVEFPDGSLGAVAVATTLDGLNRTISHLELVELLIGLGVLVLMGGGGFVLIKRSLRPLVAVETTADAIAAGDLSRRVPDMPQGTEVGRLSLAFNTMLGRIEESFEHERASEQQARASEERMRRFIGDASHELRTPLTSIRGFAELHRMGAATNADEVQRMMRRIEDEANRMGVLVEDLLLLARLDQQRPLEQVPVDLLEIARYVVHDAQVIAPDRAIDLQVRTDGAPVVTGDESRLRQVMHNLVANALTHTPAGTPVSVIVSTSDADQLAVIEVADSGPGLTAAEAEHVFERFYRADPARSRNAGGTGLGLSIVSGLVAAHGGKVSVTSNPDGVSSNSGATFRVELPLTTTGDSVPVAP